MASDVRRWNTDGDLELDSDGLGELVFASDHDRVVAFWKELAEKRYQEMVTCQETISALSAELETARRVISKLTEQRNVAIQHWMQDDRMAWQRYERAKDAEIVAIEKDGTK